MNQKLVYIFLFGLCSLNIYAQKKKPVSSAVQKQQLVKEQLPSYKRKYFVNNDGFEWYKTKSDGKFGAEDRNNKVIIPCVYDHVKLHRGNSTDWSWPCFEVKKDNYVGVYSTTGDIIISVDKGYYAIEACSDETWVVRQSWNKEKMAHFFFRKDNGCGVCDISGKELCFFEGCDAVIPSYFEGKYYYRLKRNSKCGVADGNGKIIIPISSDWLSFDYNYNFVDSDNKVVGNLSNIETRNNPLERAIEEASCKYLYECTATPIELDNLKYYKIKVNNYYGLKDAEGRSLVPCEMNELEPAGNGYLRYKRDGYWGVMSNQGKILIDTKRGYTSIGDYKTTNKRFDYTMNGYRGECDATGRQISKIKVNTPISSSSSSSSKTSSLDKSSISNTYHDVVAFELKGKVKRCKLESESVSNGYNITFDERGKLASIGKFGDEKIFDLKRSGNGYLISFKSSSTGGIVKHREYVYSNNKLTKTKLYETYDSDISISLFESIYSAALSSMLEFDRVSEFFYSNNIIVKCISITKDSEKEEKDIFIYSNYKYDKHGNWISRSVKENGKSYIEKRIIEYY